jgi:hypothetical protein
VRIEKNHFCPVAHSTTAVAYDNSLGFGKLRSILPARHRVDAYKCPLGTTAPRITVQVKHGATKVSAKDVGEMEGLVREKGTIGLIAFQNSRFGL